MWSLVGFQPKSDTVCLFFPPISVSISRSCSASLSFQLSCPNSHGPFSLALPPLLCFSLHTYAALPGSLSHSVFPFSFLLSHLVTRPLERSVEFPLSQRRGQSVPHKDPQWIPSALSSLPYVAAQLNTHAQEHVLHRNIQEHTLSLLVVRPVLFTVSFLYFIFLSV